MSNCPSRKLSLCEMKDDLVLKLAQLKLALCYTFWAQNFWDVSMESHD